MSTLLINHALFATTSLCDPMNLGCKPTYNCNGQAPCRPAVLLPHTVLHTCLVMLYMSFHNSTKKIINKRRGLSPSPSFHSSKNASSNFGVLSCIDPHITFHKADPWSTHPEVLKNHQIKSCTEGQLYSQPPINNREL